ncbi:MAG: DUF3467 domain-containing protein, partial [Planctomycetales bacterium]|nr:DUF3467 domain-containing protein [Planctomycetales bacterium]
MTHPHSDDRPDPSEQPIRARVPEHVVSGAFSTGVIVMTAQSEFILDFVQNLGRPHQIVARVVMPHAVLPQLVDALHRNIELYKNRWGELPQTGMPKVSIQEMHNPAGPSAGETGGGPAAAAPGPAPPQAPQPGAANPGTGTPGSGQPAGAGAGQPGAAMPAPSAGPSGPSSSPPPSRPSPPADDLGSRQASVQDIYDDLKIRDEFLSGAYANAVMIGHGPHEFSFDFITNFYPHSAVSARVFLAAGQIPRLYESLKGTWEQLRNRQQPPPDRENP